MTKEAKRIVAALRVVCDERSCEDCPCYDWCHMRKVNCLDDAAANMIESLSAQLEQVTRERDAAVEDLERAEESADEVCRFLKEAEGDILTYGYYQQCLRIRPGQQHKGQ